METIVGLGDKKKRTREDEERPGLGFGRGSDYNPYAAQKLIRTAGLPFLSSCTSGDGSSVATSTLSFSGSPTLFLNDDYDGGRALLPFPTPFKSPGVGMDVGGCDLRGFPLTSAQRQEIQRQALIYKHIISSVPVPSDLLISNSPPYHLPPNLVVGRGGGGTFNLRFSNRMDPEPWRCRRTDGKKWRCSRYAAPDQKYCERHMHRGRPRSRKPVEVSNTKPTSTNAPPTTAVPTNSPTIVTTTTTTASLSKPLPSQSSGLFLKDELKIPFQSLEPNKEPRCLDWMKGNNEEMESSLQWELMHSKIGLKHGTIPVLQHYEDQLTLNYAAFLNPDLCSLEENAVGNRGEAPRSFIDAWSTETPAATAEVGNSTAVPTTGELPLSTLTLSMSSTGESTDHQIQMAPVSPLGGPLGEVLQTSSATSPRQGFGANDGDSSSRGLINILSHGFHGSHEVSLQESPTRLASSPSGVLQKALVSLSDW